MNLFLIAIYFWQGNLNCISRLTVSTVEIGESSKWQYNILLKRFMIKRFQMNQVPNFLARTFRSVNKEA